MENSFSTDFRFKAISWAAGKNNMSYGQFINSHNSDEISEIYVKYELYLKSRKNEKKN